MAFQLEEINLMAKNPEEFMALSDERFNRKVDAAADAIIANRQRSPIVLLSGPSGCG